MTESEELKIARRNYLDAMAQIEKLSTEAWRLREENDRLRLEWIKTATRLDEMSVVLAGMARLMRSAKLE